MLSAFREIGYEVDVVWGWAAERQQEVGAIKQKIAQGMSYDFLYSESSTMPTLLTEKHHLPTHPWLDYGLFHLCHRANIPLGLYYRDVHWRFDFARPDVASLKSLVARFFYHLDLLAYRRWIDVLFLPHHRMLDYVPLWPRWKKVQALPPGGQLVELPFLPVEDDLQLLYVGGVVPPVYNVASLLQGVAEAIARGVRVRLTICCPQEQWVRRPREYDQWLGHWVTVVHTGGEELKGYYQTHHIAMIYWDSSAYLNITLPIKLFEAIGFGRPVVVVNGTAAADIVATEGCGWIVNSDPDDLGALLYRLSTQPDEIERATARTRAASERHTWAVRAEQVATVLCHMHHDRGSKGQ
jgi:glycosyltransferase involved in cell wall biosynthesis